MTRLIIYIDSEQKASAYRIEEDNSYSISFNGNEYESDLPTFAEIVMDELRAIPLSKMESRGGISVLLVSNGAANESIRKIMELLFHDENEEGMLNVNIQELNVIEAKYFLPLIGNPEYPSAKDFANIYSIATSSFIQQKELDDLKSDNSILVGKIKEYEDNFDKLNKELSELKEFKKTVIKKEDNKRIAQVKEEELSESIYKIDFMKDAENSGVVLSIPKGKEVIFHKRYKNGTVVSQGSTIASYTASMRWSSDEITINAKKSGRIYYVVNDNSNIKNGDIIAVIGENTWTKDDAIFFLKQSSESGIQKKNDNEPVIVKADVIKNFVSEDKLPVSFSYKPLNIYSESEELEDGALVTANQTIMKIESLFGKHEFEVKAPCDGKIFFLVPTKYEALSGWNTNIIAEKSLVMIVPESWSKSQAVEWYRSIEPLKESVELTTGEITEVKNLFPDGAFVLPNDSYIDGFVDTGWSFEENYKTTAYCGVAGRIRYKEQSAMNTSYPFFGGTIAEIY